MSSSGADDRGFPTTGCLAIIAMIALYIWMELYVGPAIHKSVERCRALHAVAAFTIDRGWHLTCVQPIAAPNPHQETER